MKTEKKWNDGGQRAQPVIETHFSTSSSVYNGNQYTVGIALTRVNQNNKRVDLYETEKLRITMDTAEAMRLAESLISNVQSLKYYEKFGTWPDYGNPAWKDKLKQANEGGAPLPTSERVNTVAIKGTVFARMDEAVPNATDSDYIVAFESIATGTLVYVVTSSPEHYAGKKRMVIMQSPKQAV